MLPPFFFYTYLILVTFYKETHSKNNLITPFTYFMLTNQVDSYKFPWLLHFHGTHLWGLCLHGCVMLTLTTCCNLEMKCDNCEKFAWEFKKTILNSTYSINIHSCCNKLSQRVVRHLMQYRNSIYTHSVWRPGPCFANSTLRMLTPKWEPSQHGLQWGPCDEWSRQQQDPRKISRRVSEAFLWGPACTAFDLVIKAQ